jgi:hypothetical protein
MAALLSIDPGIGPIVGLADLGLAVNSESVNAPGVW